jgi:hypothetical protein
MKRGSSEGDVAEVHARRRKGVDREVAHQGRRVSGRCVLVIRALDVPNGACGKCGDDRMPDAVPVSEYSARTTPELTKCIPEQKLVLYTRKVLRNPRPWIEPPDIWSAAALYFDILTVRCGLRAYRTSDTGRWGFLSRAQVSMPGTSPTPRIVVVLLAGHGSVLRGNMGGFRPHPFDKPTSDRAAVKITLHPPGHLQGRSR